MSATLIRRIDSVFDSFPQAGLEFEVDCIGRSTIVVHIAGEATCDEASALDVQLRSSMRPGVQYVILNLADLTVAGPAAIQVLAEFARGLGRQGAEVWLAGLQPAVWLALQVARLDRLFTIRASVAHALAS
jgi:anti-anti-sigma factor